MTHLWTVYHSVDVNVKYVVLNRYRYFINNELTLSLLCVAYMHVGVWVWASVCSYTVQRRMSGILCYGFQVWSLAGTPAFHITPRALKAGPHACPVATFPAKPLTFILFFYFWDRVFCSWPQAVYTGNWTMDLVGARQALYPLTELCQQPPPLWYLISGICNLL